MPMIDLIALDADDTLWENEVNYRRVEQRFREMLAHYTDAEAIERRLFEFETRNLPIFGYGIKSFVLSMIEAAVALTDGEFGGEGVQAIVDLGREMTQLPVELLPGVAETVEALAARRPLMLLTKGDLLDQEAKVERSGLAAHFQYVEVVSKKDVPTYAALLAARGVDPARFLMVGNSLKSDVLPVVEIGGQAVHIPHPLTWAHEQAAGHEVEGAAYHTLERIDELPALVDRLVEGE
jgi:putative hydrolase of the HAD superfamily